MLIINKGNKRIRPYSTVQGYLVIGKFFAIQSVNAQTFMPVREDTVYLDIPSAEQRFVSKNLSLLIKQYDVKIAQDAYLQAKLWYNPNLTYGQTLYNEDSKKFFDNNYPSEGEVDHTYQIQQLLTIGGRHSATA